MNDLNQHRAELLRQFTLQAVPFAEAPFHSAEDLLGAIREIANFTAHDSVVDAGCGPGLVAIHFAKHVQHVSGVDVTPAMLDQARARSAAAHVQNVTFTEGDMTALPFPDASFDGAYTRFTFHHVLDVASAFNELVRVVRPGGRVVLIDVAPPPDKRAAFDHAETLRDPSHTRALTLEEMIGLGEMCGLGPVTLRRCGLTVDFEAQLAKSFPNPGDGDRLRELLRKDLGVDQLGMSVQMPEGVMRFTYPLAILGWTKPGVR